MKTPLALFLGIVLSLFAPLVPSSYCVAQAPADEKLAYLDADGHPAAEKDAALLRQIVRLDDSLWEINLYKAGGPMISSARYSDPDGKTLNGRYITYDQMGNSDTLGDYSGGNREGEWLIYAHGRRYEVGQLTYKDGELIGTRDSVQLKRLLDSVGDVYAKDSGKVAEHLFTRVQTQADFAGGSMAWLRFLNKTLRYPDYDVDKNIMGTVVVGFIVEKNGHIPPNSLWLFHSVEYHLDQEALHVFRVSPDWVPAIQDGNKVRSYKKQPIAFRLQVG